MNGNAFVLSFHGIGYNRATGSNALVKKKGCKQKSRGKTTTMRDAACNVLKGMGDSPVGSGSMVRHHLLSGPFYLGGVFYE